jgi:anti-anti-sigma regulatory factor
MAGRSRHGLHVVEEGRPPGGPSPVRFTEDGGKRPFLSLHQQSVVLRIGGLLNADTAGRLRLFLSMFTVDGGPAEVVLDLAAVHAVDEDGMAPIYEADESMGLRRASLRLASVSPAVAHHLGDARSRTLTTGAPPDPTWPDPIAGPVVPALDDGSPRPGQDRSDR